MFIDSFTRLKEKFFPLRESPPVILPFIPRPPKHRPWPWPDDFPAVLPIESEEDVVGFFPGDQ